MSNVYFKANKSFGQKDQTAYYLFSKKSKIGPCPNILKKKFTSHCKLLVSENGNNNEELEQREDNTQSSSTSSSEKEPDYLRDPFKSYAQSPIHSSDVEESSVQLSKQFVTRPNDLIDYSYGRQVALSEKSKTFGSEYMEDRSKLRCHLPPSEKKNFDKETKDVLLAERSASIEEINTISSNRDDALDLMIGNRGSNSGSDYESEYESDSSITRNNAKKDTLDSSDEKLINDHSSYYDKLIADLDTSDSIGENSSSENS